MHQQKTERGLAMPSVEYRTVGRHHHFGCDAEHLLRSFIFVALLFSLGVLLAGCAASNELNLLKQDPMAGATPSAGAAIKRFEDNGITQPQSWRTPAKIYLTYAPNEGATPDDLYNQLVEMAIASEWARTSTEYSPPEKAIWEGTKSLNGSPASIYISLDSDSVSVNLTLHGQG